MICVLDGAHRGIQDRLSISSGYQAKLGHIVVLMKTSTEVVICKIQGKHGRTDLEKSSCWLGLIVQEGATQAAGAKRHQVLPKYEPH